MERAIRIRPSLRVQNSARAHTPAVGAAAHAMELSHNESACADFGFKARAFSRQLRSMCASGGPEAAAVLSRPAL